VTRRFQFLVYVGHLIFLIACTRAPTPVNSEHSVDFQSASSFIAQCYQECAQFEASLIQAGGTIQQRYRNINAVAFQLSPQAAKNISSLAKFPIYKDININQPQPIEKMLLDSQKQKALKVSEISANWIRNINPKTYLLNNQLTNVDVAHKNGNLGQDVIVAIIDSGTANNPEIVPTLAGNVIGGENFVPTENEPSATSTKNDEHGTLVGTMIAGHAALTTEKTTELATAISKYAPESLIPINDTEVEIPLIGSAPGAKIYALKTFGADGDGAPSSRIIAAIDRVLTLKTNFNNGLPSEPIAGDGSEDNPFVYDSLNIQVLNMSLGGPALFPGHEIEDLLSDVLLQAGVVVVASAGNEGFAGITGGSPGTSFGSIAVGAANSVVHERIFRELRDGPDQGLLFRPTDFMQIATFSSRGPTADGRHGVDLVANGVASFAQGADGSLGLVSGTSFSAPTVAGAAALLVKAFPDATAADISSALIEGANSDIFLPSTSIFDQGHGFLNVAESLEILSGNDVDSNFPLPRIVNMNSKVLDNIQHFNLDVLPISGSEINRRLNLSPGEVQQFFIETNGNTSELEVEIENMIRELPIDQQNTLFGDNIILTVVDAPLSFDDTRFRDFITADQEITINNPQEGLVRVAVMGDWTNQGNISASVSIERKTAPKLSTPILATIAEGDSHQYEFMINADTTQLALDLNWTMNWAFYPSHDLDLIVFDPDGNLFLDGATLDSPERLIFEAPTAGVWTIIVEGFLLHGMQDEYSLSVANQNNIPLVSIN